VSTRYAQEETGEKAAVQHHHAHIVSCMAEHHLKGPLIGLSFDGTGYGTDGNIWGGEILIAEAGGFVRAAHPEYVLMPGSAAAVRAPWRMAVSYLYDTFGESFWNLDLPVLKEIDENKVKFIIEMIRKRVNTPCTSSIGRLFDGIAGIMGIRNHVSFEGQAAMELEMLAEENAGAIYDYDRITGDVSKILLHPIVRGVVRDMEKGCRLSEISGKFHKTLICLFSEQCEIIRKENGLNRAALSGGVFQNSILLNGLTKELSGRGFEVFTNTRVPVNDGGISLGQAAVAAARAGDKR